MNEEARTKILRARSALIITQPFWGVLSMNLRLQEAQIPTMATDGESLYYGAAFVLETPDAELRGVIAHEVEHVARLHVTRRGQRDPKDWNRACDYAINPGLLAGGFRLPSGFLNDSRFAGQTAETIYQTLRKENEANTRPGAPQNGPGKPGQGMPGQGQQGQQAPGSANGQGQPSPAETDGGVGQILDAPGGAAAREKIEGKIQQAVRQAASVAKAKGAGKLPGYAADIIAELDRPRIDWRAKLRKFADDSRQRETSWTRPNRRFASGGFIMPGHEATSPAHVVFAWDCSGSMGAEELRVVGSETQGALDDKAIDRLTSIQFDTRIVDVKEYEAGDVIELHANGRGGTAFAPVMQWVRKNAPDASALIVLSDMDNFDHDGYPDPGIPVLWCAIGRNTKAPAFGEVVAIDPNE